MIFDVDQCAREIQEARHRAEAILRGLSSGELTRQPESGKWSIAECILHLNATAAVVQPLMEKAIVQARQDKKVGAGPFNIGLKGRLLVWIAEPPPKFRMPAPRNVRPPAKIDDPGQLLPNFMKAQDEWQRLIRESAGLDLAKIKLGPFFSPLRQRLAASFPWMMAHQRRHLLQAENVKRQIVSAASIAATSTI